MKIKDISRKLFAVTVITVFLADISFGQSIYQTSSHYNTRSADRTTMGDISEAQYENDGLVIRIIETEIIQDPANIADWSYEMESPILSSLRIADVDGDGVLDVICTSYGPPPNPYSSGQIAVFDIEGSFLPGWPDTTGAPVPATAAIGDVDNDGDQELVVGDWSNMYVLNHDGSNYSGWPIGNGISYSPSLEDLDGDGDLEIIYPSGHSLYIRHHDGSLFPGWPVSAPEDIGSPAIADIDNDGELEIAAGTLAGPVGPEPYEFYVWNLDGTVLPGFPVATSGVVKSTPAIGDVDNDGLLEIVVASYDVSNDDFIYCWDHEGNSEPGWPIRAQYCRLSSPALGDVDGDGDLEIFIGGLQTTPAWIEILYAYHHDGQNLENWPVELPHEGSMGNINSSPVIAEVDGDLSSPEIFVKTHDYIFGLNADGTSLDDFPYYLSDNSHSGTHSPSPAIGDLDNDGDADFIFASSSGSVVYVDGQGSFDSALSAWPMYKHDQYGTGRYGFDIQSDIDTDNFLPTNFGSAQNYPNPFNATTSLKYGLDHADYVTLTIYNILGQRAAILFEGFQQAGEHSITWDASDYPSGVYFVRLEMQEQSKSIKMVLLK